ncbi:hypothetical protein RA266_27980, partial [Pseudomonas syringae pv. tagetis]
ENNLYHSVENGWLRLAFYVLFRQFSEELSRLHAQAPSIIVSRAQVLRALALGVLWGENLLVSLINI